MIYVENTAKQSLVLTQMFWISCYVTLMSHTGAM